MRMTTARWFLLTAAAAGLLYAGGKVFRPSPIDVEVGEVSCGPMRVTVTAEGRSRVRDRFVVSTPIAGRLGRIALREGDAVRQGSLVGWVQSADASGDVPGVTMHAPRAGVVLKVLEQNERVVSAGTPVVEIGDPASLEIVFDVLSVDAVSIRPGAPVLLRNWGGEGTLETTVRTVEPSAFTKLSALGVEEQRVHVIGLLGNVAAIGDGFRVDGDIVIWQSPDSMQVPLSALFRVEKQWAVFVVENGKALRRDVEIGRRNETAAEVLRGLKENDPVVLYPDDRLSDGAAVR